MRAFAIHTWFIACTFFQCCRLFGEIGFRFVVVFCLYKRQCYLSFQVERRTYVRMYSIHIWLIKTNGICAMNPFSFGMAHSSRLLNHLNSFRCFSLSFHFGLQSICPCTKYTHSLYTEKCPFWTSKWEQMEIEKEMEKRKIEGMRAMVIEPTEALQKCKIYEHLKQLRKLKN